ncbi:MAG: hypothetical protein JXX29_21060 [Deltaproteobacteria bacterium]|nr:hypothetical protein [Deltaproteobacteria bacterium]MBN2674185.1 hypothetical protein [Deltaproteobacteria bacterium]
MSNRLVELLKCLNDSEIEYILVGGMAAVLHGAPVSTYDLDIVHRRTDDNIERLLTLLKTLDARYRGQPAGRILSPSSTALAGNGHNNLMTALGPLDVLCELTLGLGYDELLPFTEQITGDSLTIPVLSLKKLIEIKAATGRAKDLIMIPILMKLDK